MPASIRWEDWLNKHTWNKTISWQKTLTPICILCTHLCVSAFSLVQRKDRKCCFETRISPVICCNAYFSCALAISFHFFCIFYVFILYLLYLCFVFIFRVIYNFRFVSLYYICRSWIEQYLNLTWWIYWCFIFFVQKMTKWFALPDDILTSLALKKKKKEGFRIDTHLWKICWI